jgi:hypothetical protein
MHNHKDEEELSLRFKIGNALTLSVLGLISESYIFK